MHLVFDACALIAFLRREDGADAVRDLLRDEANTNMAHAINVCEVYHDVLRISNEETAQAALAALDYAGLVIRTDMDAGLWQEAGRLKAHGRLSLADCFAIALARQTGAEVITSDHREFEPVAAAGICTVRFFR